MEDEVMLQLGRWYGGRFVNVMRMRQRKRQRSEAENGSVVSSRSAKLQQTWIAGKRRLTKRRLGQDWERQRAKEKEQWLCQP